MGALTLKHFEKTYPNGHQAVKGLSLDIEPGEFVVLVGPSGCGKSTILRSIAGLESLTGGEIHIGDRRVDTEPPAKRDIAMVFQNYALYPHMTVYKNLAYGLKNRGVGAADIDRKVREAADLLQINDYLDRKPQQLSGGQRQRVAMGRAIVRDPQLFLFDEPLSNLDAKLRAHMRLEIKKLQRTLSATSIFVTHDQVEAMTLADRIVVLNGGEIEQVGTPREVYHRPASLFVASFMGAPAMNFFKARVDGGDLVLADGQRLALPTEQVSALNGATDITLGVRPEQITVTETVQDGLVTFDVGMGEELGVSQLLHGQVADAEVVLNLPKFERHDERQLGLSWPVEAWHLFDSRSGQRL